MDRTEDDAALDADAAGPQDKAQMPEKNVVRRHTFFCVDRKRHTDKKVVIEAIPKQIRVLGRLVDGWIITTEEPVIDKTITLEEAMEGLGVHHDPE